jgi:hypothetical protein
MVLVERPLKDIGEDTRIILKWILNRIHLAQDTDKPPTALMQWFNWHFHFFQHSEWLNKLGYLLYRLWLNFPYWFKLTSLQTIF